MFKQPLTPYTKYYSFLDIKDEKIIKSPLSFSLIFYISYYLDLKSMI